MTHDEYVTALKRHDWSYDYSSDQRLWRRGLEQRQALQAAQPTLDPDFSIWNQYAPLPEFKRTPK